MNAHAEQLSDRRSLAADAAFAAYDFGAEPSDSSGWETTQPSDETSRPVFFDDGGRAAFVVRFRPGSDAIAEAYAITPSGGIFGSMPTA